MMEINAKGVHYRDLNKKIRGAITIGDREILLRNINGQRHISNGIRGDLKIFIEGVPGNDLAAFIDGPTIIVNTNAQDAVGNTMNDGKIVIHGDAGDLLGYGMRGGKLFVKGNVGYRVGIHMKTYKEKAPIMIVGGLARDFLGEYMAGGILILLGLNKKTPIIGNYIGTGMHGGAIYIRGNVKEHQLGKEIVISETTEEDEKLLIRHLTEYCQYFNLDLHKLLCEKFTKLIPVFGRPYRKVYAY